MNYHISILEDSSRIDELIELFSLGLGDTTAEHWMWRVFTPNGLKQPEAIIAETESGQIIAMTTLLFEEFGNREYRALQFCDWVVHPDYRNRGILGNIYHFAYEKYKAEGFDFIIEYPNSNSYPIFMKYGFEEKSHIDCWNSHKRLIHVKKRPINIERKGVSYVFSDTCPLKEIEPRSDRIFRPVPFLKWKYDKNPNIVFKWLLVTDSKEILGYFVFTLVRGRVRTAVNVYDWSFKKTHPKEFSESISCLKRLGNFVSVWGRYHECDESLLQYAGLKRKDSGTKLVLKKISEKGYPEELTLTRIDTDY